jgi:hypothetical protein
MVAVTAATGMFVPDLVSASPAANQNDYAPGLNPGPMKSVLSLTPTNSIKITGISTSGWPIGKQLTIRNNSSITGAGGRLIILERNSTSSIAANRFQYQKINTDMAPILLMPQDELMFYFDGTDLKHSPSYGAVDRTHWDRRERADRIAIAGTAPSGAGATVTQDLVETDSNGIVTIYTALITGTTTTGQAMGEQSNINGPGASRFGSGAHLWLGRVNVPVLSTVSDEFVCIAGINNSINLNPNGMTNGVGWKYDRLNSTSWRNFCRAGGTETIQNAAPVVTAGRFDVLGLFVNGNATNVDFFYSTDGGETWAFNSPITTNVPNGSGAGMSICGAILKSAGTTSREVHFGGVGAGLERWIS